MKKMLRWLAVLLVLILIVLIWVPIPLPLNKTLNAYEVKHDDPNYGVPRTVSISGTYRFYLFRPDVFQGRIEIEGYPQTRGYEVPRLAIDRRDSMPLTYVSDTYLLKSFGSLLSDPLMERLFICVMQDGSWNGADGISLIAPAQNAMEAGAVYKRMAEKNTWLAAVTWPFKQ